MAMIAVQIVLEKLASVLAEEAQLLDGVRGDVDELREDLESMKSFLQDAETKSRSDEGVRTWVKQVRDVSYDTEDVLAEYLHCLSPPQGPGVFHSLRRGLHYIQKLRTRHHLAVQIKRIRQRVKAISNRRNAFSFQSNGEVASSNALQTWHDPRLASLFIDEADVVGIENPRCLLIKWLTSGGQNLTTISVVGMGGLGKTTLTKKTYDSPPVKRYFDSRSWVTVSKSFAVVELLQMALVSFLEEAKEPVPEGIYSMSELQLVKKLRNYLQQKRYVVVFDDIWSINAWEAVKFAFPDHNCGSRIIFTTRIKHVATAVETNCHVYDLQPLPDKEAWTLFCMKAFRGEYKGVCPIELVEMSHVILKKCGGLRLAIVIIGGLLSKKNKLIVEWKKVLIGLGAEIKSNSSLESLERVLLLSYTDLPYYLKCCYLYLSVFPEDYLIKRMKLIRLWVAERFVEERPGLTMEEVAEEYLNELVSRSMVEVVQLNYFNRVYTCRVHDLMRELIQLRTRHEAFVMILNKERLALNEKIRRIAVHDGCKDILFAKAFPGLRSLLVFTPAGSSMSLRRACFQSFRLLRVLDLDNATISHLPAEVSRMIHLRYLSLRRTPVLELPESIGKLKYLEILDLKYSLVSSMPDSILRLEHLVQLHNYRFPPDHPSRMFRNMIGMRVPAGIGNLTNLQKLGSVEVNGNGGLVKELGKLVHLRRLGILQLRREDGVGLCSSLDRLKHLTSLYMASITSNEFLPLNSLSSPPRFLQCLYLKCNLPALPKWIDCLQHLAQLVLQYSHLNNDPLKGLQGLPNLVVLELREAYDGMEMCCDSRGYPRLKKLLLFQLKGLKTISLEEGAMPRLRELDIISCEKLDMIPSGIEYLRDLQYLGLLDMTNEFLHRIERSQGDDYWKVEHISTIHNQEIDMRKNIVNKQVQ